MVEWLVAARGGKGCFVRCNHQHRCAVIPPRAIEDEMLATTQGPQTLQSRCGDCAVCVHVSFGMRCARPATQQNYFISELTAVSAQTAAVSCFASRSAGVS